MMTLHKHHTFVCLGGLLPRVSLQYTLGFPTDCFILLPRLIITSNDSGKHCKRNSAFSWKRGGPDWIKYCKTEIASAAATDCALETSAGHADQAYLRRNIESKAASWIASELVLSDVIKWEILSVAGSVALRRGKLLKIAFKAFKYSSLTVPLAHKSFSIAAARP